MELLNVISVFAIVALALVLYASYAFLPRQRYLSSLVRQAYRWHVASLQDANPVIAMLHSNYAMGYVGALRSLDTEAGVKLATGIDLPTLEREVAAQQDKSLVALLSACPTLVPSSPAYENYVEAFLKNKTKS